MEATDCWKIDRYGSHSTSTEAVTEIYFVTTCTTLGLLKFLVSQHYGINSYIPYTVTLFNITQPW